MNKTPTQKIIDEIAQNFDQKFCDGKLLKYGSVNLTLKDDHEFLRACPEDSYGVTYTYPTQNRWKFLKRGFAIFIAHYLSDPKNKDLLIDTVLHELIHAKVHMDRLSDMDDHGPTFLRYASKVTAHFRIQMKINEHFEGGFFIKGKKAHDSKIIIRVRNEIYRERKKQQNVQ
jgi:hypothetical protein